MFVVVPSRDSGQLMYKSLELPDAFQGNVSKGKVRDRGLRLVDNSLAGSG